MCNLVTPLVLMICSCMKKAMLSCYILEILNIFINWKHIILTLVSRMYNQTYEAGIQNKDKIETIQELVTSIYFKSPSFRHFRRYCLQLRWPQRLLMKWFEPGIFSAPLRSEYFSLRSLSLFSSLCLLAISAFSPHSSK